MRRYPFVFAELEVLFVHLQSLNTLQPLMAKVAATAPKPESKAKGANGAGKRDKTTRGPVAVFFHLRGV